MSTLELTLTLPDQLAREAQAAGLLTPKAIELLLEEAVHRRAAKDLLQMTGSLAAEDSSSMSPEEVQAEISAYRAEKKHASGH